MLGVFEAEKQLVIGRKRVYSGGSSNKKLFSFGKQKMKRNFHVIINSRKMHIGEIGFYIFLIILHSTVFPSD